MILIFHIMSLVKTLRRVATQRPRHIALQGHGFASVSAAPIQAPLSRFEPDLKVDYTDFTNKVATLRRQYDFSSRE